MIENDITTFPQNVIEVIASRVKPVIDSEISVFRRPLRTSDPNQSFGVFPNLWQPNTDSFEMRGRHDPGPNEPTLQTYSIGLQAFVKDMDEERGLAIHSVFAMRVRDMLYRDQTLRVGLASLSSTAGGSTERAKNWGIRTQRYLSNELEGSWLHLSTLEFWLETEKI